MGVRSFDGRQNARSLDATRTLVLARALAIAVLCIAGAAHAAGTASPSGPVSARDVEPYVVVPMPPGFQVESTELEGPVFADAQGRTLYTWPQKHMRGGYAGETKGIPTCLWRSHPSHSRFDEPLSARARAARAEHATELH